MKRVLTGIKPTGVPHIGNVLGAIEPALALNAHPEHEGFLFIADLHSLTIRPDAADLRDQTRSVAATWLALGLDPEQVCFYRQSRVPEVTELSWILSCSLPMGLLNRAHSFKDAQAKGAGLDEINHGIFAYPVLMAADILALDSDIVPVGKDQKQHLEITQEAARKFNLRYGEVLKLPEARIDPSVMTIPGVDGRKMSKTYGNTIVPFDDEKTLMKKIKGIATDSTEYGAPLETDGDILFQLHALLAPGPTTEALRASYASGRKDPRGPDEPANYFGWGDAKKAVHRTIVERFSAAREAYHTLMATPDRIDALLERGEGRARSEAAKVLARVRRAIGLTL
ncbi:MAG: tryptophan--tRNA ligase [Myxococcota bacterium]